MTEKTTNQTSSGFWERLRFSAERVRALVCLQIGDKLRRRSGKERGRFAFRIFLLVLAAILVTAAFTAVCILLQSMFYISLTRNTLASLLFAMQLVAIFADVGAMQRIFFTDKENSLLLAFPCNFREIVASRLILFFLKETKKNCFFLTPFLIGFAIATKQGVGFYLFIPIAHILLSAFPIFVDCVLSIVMLYAKRFIYSKPFFCILTTVALFSAVFYVAYRLLLVFPDPLRLLQEYSKYISNIVAFIDKAAKYSVHYKAIASILVGMGTFKDFLVLLGVFLGAALVGIGLLIPFYFKAVSSTAERSAKNKTDKVAKKNRRISVKGKRRFSLYRTFLHKEILTTVRDPHQLSSTISSFFVLPIVSYIMNYLLDAINTNPLGDYMVIAFNIMISASLLSAFNIECAYALSSEGLEFAILKTAPSNTAAMVWGKITVTLVSNFVAIAATTAMLYFTTEIKVLDLILLSVTLFLLAMSMVLWSFQLDVRRPQFSEYASKGSAGVVDNPNVALATLLGFIIATLAGALTLLMLYDDYITGWLRILGITLGVCVARIYLFSRNLQVYFKELEL